MESIVELSKKIKNYEEQLHQVDSLISSDPSNDQYLKLREDLIKIISLTRDLESFQNETENPNCENTAESLDFFQVGDKVEVCSGDRPYAGVVVRHQPSLSECTVKYFEFEEEVTLPLNKLTKLLSGAFDASMVKPPGFKCQCKYASDQRWYDCTVDAVTEFGYMITYTQYGVSEEVPLEYLRPCLEKGQKDREREKGQDKMTEPNGLIPIPESLKILPTDTEEEKNRKKKRLKAIKSQNRLKTQETEISSTQKTWQSFVGKKSVKRAAPGAIKETSMFASPEEVDGRVGVTRSGLGMTDFEKRKRHNFGPLGGR